MKDKSWKLQGLLFHDGPAGGNQIRSVGWVGYCPWFNEGWTAGLTSAILVLVAFPGHITLCVYGPHSIPKVLGITKGLRDWSKFSGQRRAVFLLHDCVATCPWVFPSRWPWEGQLTGAAMWLPGIGMDGGTPRDPEFLISLSCCLHGSPSPPSSRGGIF